MVYRHPFVPMSAIAGLVLLFVAPAPAEAPPVAGTGDSSTPTVQLAFKFRPDESVHYRDRFRSTIHLRDGDVTIDTRNRQDSLKHYRVLTVDSEGRGILETVIDRLKISAQSGADPPTAVDSTAAPDACPEEYRPLLRLVGRPLTRSRFSNSGRLLQVLSISRALLEARPGTTVDSFKSIEGGGNFLFTLPEKPVSVGEEWTEDFPLFLTDKGGTRRRIMLRRTFRLKAIRKGLATITSVTRRLTPVSDPSTLAQLIQRTPTSKVVFDIERGMLISRETRTDQTVIGAFGARTLMRATTTRELVLVDPVPDQRPSLEER